MYISYTYTCTYTHAGRCTQQHILEPHNVRVGCNTLSSEISRTFIGSCDISLHRVVFPTHGEYIYMNYLALPHTTLPYNATRCNTS